MDADVPDASAGSAGADQGVAQRAA